MSPSELIRNAKIFKAHKKRNFLNINIKNKAPEQPFVHTQTCCFLSPPLAFTAVHSKSALK